MQIGFKGTAGMFGCSRSGLSRFLPSPFGIVFVGFGCSFFFLHYYFISRGIGRPFCFIPYLVNTNKTIPASHQTTISAILSFPVCAAYMCSIYNSLTTVRPLFAIITRIIMLIRITAVTVFIALYQVQTDTTVVVMFSTFSIRRLRGLGGSFLYRFLFLL